jgi:tetratricopeptide (TPR) repeat protein
VFFSVNRIFANVPLTLLAVTEIACQRKAEGPPPRYAILRFENLTGDSSLDWTGRAASEILSVSLSGGLDGPVLNPSALERLGPSLGNRPAAAPGISAGRTEALFAGATRLISGYVERDANKMRIVATEESLANGKTLRTLSTEADAPLPALARLARQFSSGAKPYLTSNASAAQHYFSALEAPFDKSRVELEDAVRMDPNFGPAWLSLIRLTIVRGDRAGAESLIARARTQKLDALSMANLDSEAAALSGDQAARTAALRKMSALSPGDTLLLRSVAESETAAGQFQNAAGDWKKLTSASPRDPAVWNSLGYALSYAGDLTGALAAFQEYGRLSPKDANPLDSTGDLYYAYRKFPEAAASYLQAHAKDPKFQRAGDLYKAAWAKFSAGDKSGGDELFSQFRGAREKSPDNLTPLLSADWLYRTGRVKEANDLLRGVVKDPKSSAALRAEAYSQLAIWDLLAGDRKKALEDATASGNPTSAPVVLMRFAAQPSATAAEWQARADRLMGGPALGALRRLALGYALLLDGKREAALPVWQEIVKTTPATDFFSRAVYLRLQGKSPERALLPDPNNVNQFSALADKI